MVQHIYHRHTTNFTSQSTGEVSSGRLLPPASSLETCHLGWTASSGSFVCQTHQQYCNQRFEGGYLVAEGPCIGMFLLFWLRPKPKKIVVLNYSKIYAEQLKSSQTVNIPIKYKIWREKHEKAPFISLARIPVHCDFPSQSSKSSTGY